MPSEYSESSSEYCCNFCTRSFFFTPILRHISWEGPGLGWGRPGDARDGEGQAEPTGGGWDCVATAVRWRACPMSAARSGLSHDLCFQRTSARSKAPTIVAQSTRSKAVACLCSVA